MEIKKEKVKRPPKGPMKDEVDSEPDQPVKKVEKVDMAALLAGVMATK